ncbi:MAG: hypothetical protein KDJ65_23925 [Anaerolineae bacterium]|nr:hypothetical protein [Anaerolineae bacterium]
MLKNRINRSGAHTFMLGCLMSLMLFGCQTTHTAEGGPQVASSATCPVTEAVKVKPPDDAAVQGAAEESYYIVNKNRSIWVSAWWYALDGYAWQAGEQGNKVGWFRPAGADLTITGRPLDSPPAELEASVPCCYQGRFQATGLMFPRKGCWEVTAKAGGEVLTFVVMVEG